MEKNKTGKYLKYAIGEIILVVIGILLALQISEWNTSFKRHQAESQLLHDIHQEFLENKAQLELVKTNHLIPYEATEQLLKLLPHDIVKIEIDSVVALLDRTFNNWTFNPHQSTINTLINTSSFDLISNLELRKLLQSWPDLFLDYTEEEIRARDQVSDFYKPYMAKHYETKYVKNKRPFTELDWDFLQSVEFHNVIAMRNNSVKNIFESYPNGFDAVSETIDKIIELTAQ